MIASILCRLSLRVSAIGRIPERKRVGGKRWRRKSKSKGVGRGRVGKRYGDEMADQGANPPVASVAFNLHRDLVRPPHVILVR